MIKRDNILQDRLRELYDNSIADEEHTANNREELEIARLQEELVGLKQDREQRKIFSYSLFGFMCLYMAASLAITILSGCFALHLSDTVLITLLTTTLADVIGVFAFVAKYLFHFRD